MGIRDYFSPGTVCLIECGRALARGARLSPPPRMQKKLPANPGSSRSRLPCPCHSPGFLQPVFNAIPMPHRSLRIGRSHPLQYSLPLGSAGFQSQAPSGTLLLYSNR